MDTQVVGVSSSKSSHRSASRGRKSFLIDSLLEERQRKLLSSAASTHHRSDGRENSFPLRPPSSLGATKKASYQLPHSGRNSPATIPEPPEEPSFPPTDPSPSPISTVTHSAGSANGHSVGTSNPMNNYTSFMELLAKFAEGNVFKQAVDPLQRHAENSEERLSDGRRQSAKKACKALPLAAQQGSPGNPLLPPLPFVINQQAVALVGGMTNPAYVPFLQQQYAAFLQSLWNPLLMPVPAGKKPSAGAYARGTIPPSFPNLFVNTSKEPTSAVIGQLTSHRLKHEGSVLSKFKTSPTPVTKMRMSLNTYTAAKSAASVPSFSSSSSSSSNVKKYRCDICNKTFSRSNTLITHKTGCGMNVLDRRIHTGEKPFKCQHCGRAFRQPGNLTRHAYTHTTVKPFICEACGKAFNRASNLHTHRKIHCADDQDDE